MALKLAGQRFGMLVAERACGKDSHGRNMWACVCDCGKPCAVAGFNLRSGNSTSCGCQRTGAKRLIDLRGQRFGRLLVVGRANKSNGKGRTYWSCVCECGASVDVWAAALRVGHTQSCGCLCAERLRAAVIVSNRRRRGPLASGWKPELPDADRRGFRDSVRKVEWRSAVFTRDGFRCRKCNNGGRLNAHHVEPYNAAPDRRWDLDNGITLCVSCHREFHSAYGHDISAACCLPAWMGEFDRKIALIEREGS